MAANTVLKTIHVACRDLGMDNDTRRDLQVLVTGKDSLTAMTPVEHLAVLEGAGFAVISADIIPRPTPVPSGMSAWLNTFRGGFIDSVGVPEKERAQVIEDTRALLRPILADESGNWTADYVRCRFAAVKPE